jgi:hypothetical protein
MIAAGDIGARGSDGRIMGQEDPEGKSGVGPML